MKRFLTHNALSYLRFWARKALDKHHPLIIGIAGSVGKTSTRNAVEAILKDHFPTQSIGNSETGIPLGILGMKPEDYTKFDWLKMLGKSPLKIDSLKGTQYLIAEMGIDEPDPPKNMDYLLTILEPDIAVSLNVSATHSHQFDKTVKKEGLSGEERLQQVIHNIAHEDTKIVTKSHAKIGIYNADDEIITKEIVDKTPTATKLLSFGSKSTNTISYGLYKVSLEGTSFSFYIKTEEKREELTITFTEQVLPREYREVFAAAILIALQTNLTLTQIKESLEKNYRLPKGRASIFKGINQSVIFDSTYNASKASTTAFLDLIDTLKKETDRPVTFILGDMRELGKESKIEHEAIAAKLIGTVDYLYLVGPLTREYVLPVVQEHDSLFKEIRWFDTSLRVGEFLKDHLATKSIVLAKGSQNTIFLEEAVKSILADKKDSQNLCRQDDFWLNLKKTPSPNVSE